MADVFISYSRKDKEFVQQLDEALKRRGREAWVDWEGIRPTEEFMRAIYGAIEAADTFVFVLTPDSIASVVCGREIAHAAAHNKRMVPVVARDVNAADVPEALAKLNWIFCRETDDFAKAIETLITALDIDLAWVHAHTRLLTRAIEWEAKGKNNSFVLRGDDLRDAEQWLAQAGTDKERQPTALQTGYIIASRKAAANRQRITLGAVSAGLVVSLILAVLAWSQRNEAQSQARIAGAGRLAGFGLSYLRDQLPLALLLGVEACRAADTAEARNTLLSALQMEPGLSTFLHGHRGPVTSIAFSPDGSTLVSGGFDGSVRLWDWKQRRQVAAPLHVFEQRHSGSSNEVRCLSFSPDGASVAAGTQDGDFCIWDVSARRLRGEAVRFGGTVTSVVFSPDSKSLAVSNVVDLSLRNAATGERIGEPILGLGAAWQPQFGAGEPACVAFSRDGKLLALDVREELWLWEIATRQPLGKLTGHTEWITQLAFSPDGKVIASGDRTGVVRLWDVVRRQPIGEPIVGRSGWVLHLAFSADGKILSWGGLDGAIHRYDWEHATFIGQPIFVGEMASFTVSPDSRQIAVGAKDGTIRLWEVEPAPLLGEQIGGRTSHLAFSKDGTLLAVSGEHVEIFDARARKKLGTLEYWDGVQSLAFVGASKVLAMGCQDGTVRLWNAVTRQPIGAPLVGHLAGSYIWSIASSPDGKLLASGGSDGTLRFWDAQARSPLGESLEGHKGGVYCVAFSSDGTVLASGGDDKNVRLWDPRTRRPQGSPLPGHLAAVWSATFDPTGKVLCTGDDAGGVLLWDVASHRPRGELPRSFVNRVSGLSFSPDGKTLVMAGFGGTLRFVDAESRQPLGVSAFTEGEYFTVNAIAFSPDGKTLAVGLNNPPGLFLLDASLDTWQRRAARRANRNLSLAEWKRFFGTLPYRRTFAELPPGEGVSDD
ncbi:MAG TPA: TIR domain-containing protein [Terrimicrobiaceae bacterium]